jgi:hypothetical protein
MFLSIIGRHAVILVSLVASPPIAVADQFFRGSSRHSAINGCASFTTENSCVTGGGGCAWHPNVGCASSLALGVNSGDDEGGMRASRNLQATSRPTRSPTTRRPKNSPITRHPTNLPTTRRPTNTPTSKPSVSRFCALYSTFMSLVHKPDICLNK